MTSALPTAAALIEARRFEDALAALLPAWREVRDPALGQVIDAVSALIERPAIQTLGKRVVDQQAAWLALAKARHDADGERLFSSLGAVNSTLAERRIEVLRDWRPDPRIGQALIGLVELPPFQGSPSAPFWRVLWALLPVHADARVLERLAPLVGTFGNRLGAEPMIRLFETRAAAIMETVAAELATRPSLSEAQRALVQGMLATLSARQARAPSRRSAEDEEQLLQAVAANLDDSGPRLVFADWLEERGDPRAELIRLGFLRSASAQPSARERALWKKLGPGWLGPVWPVTSRSGMIFDRGFLDRAQLQIRSDSALLRAVGAPRWATVRGLSVLAGSPNLASLLGHPVLANLRLLESVSADLLAGLVGSPTAGRLWHLGVQVALRASDAPSDLARVFGTPANFPSLRSLDLRLPMYLDARAGEAILQLPELGRVESLTFTMDATAEERLLKMLLPLLRRSATLRRDSSTSPWSASVADGVLRLHVETIGPWGKILRALPGSALRGVELSGGAVESVIRAAARFGATIV